MQSNRNFVIKDIERKLRECLNSAETSNIMKNIDLYYFAFFVSGGFSNLSQAVSELGGSGAQQSMQNNLAHLTEGARLPMDGCAGN